MSTVAKIIRALPRAAGDPLYAAQLFRRRIFPYGIQTKDHESYRLASWSYGDLPRTDIGTIVPDVDNVSKLVMHFPLKRTQDLSIDLIELGYLLSIVRHTGAKKILEIGTWDGNTALNLAANVADDGMVTTVDLPPDATGAMVLPISSMLNNMTDRNQMGIQYKNTPEEKKITQVYGDSAKIDWQTLGGPFDMIFIDGCHAFAYVKSDTEAALSVLANGGTIIWHDYGMIQDVSTYLDKLASKLPIQIIKRTRMAVAYNIQTSQQQECLHYSKQHIVAA